MNTAPEHSDERGAVAAVLAMAENLAPLALAELERALRLKLHPPLAAAARRVAELGFLVKLIDERRDQGQPGLVPRSIYDERRSREAPDAPKSQRLVERYGGWNRVCRAASSMRADGRVHGDGVPYANTMRGSSGITAYTREEAGRAIRRCALELGRLPSAGVYQHWMFDVKRQARDAGLELPRLPGITAVYRFYKPWRSAVAAAAITEAEIAHARVVRVLRIARVDALPPAPLEALAAAAPSALSAIGIDPARRNFLAKHGIAQVTLSEGIQLAQLLGGSLDWLAGVTTSPGQPPQENATFDHPAIERLLEEEKVDVTELRRRLELQIGPWRRLRNGKREPMLYELVVIAAAAGTDVEQLLVVPTD